MTLEQIIRPIVEGQVRAYLHAHPENVTDHRLLTSGIGKRITHDICAPDTVRRIELALRGAGCGCEAVRKSPREASTLVEPVGESTTLAGMPGAGVIRRLRATTE